MRKSCRCTLDAATARVAGVHTKRRLAGGLFAGRGAPRPAPGKSRATAGTGARSPPPSPAGLSCHLARCRSFLAFSALASRMPPNRSVRARALLFSPRIATTMRVCACVCAWVCVRVRVLLFAGYDATRWAACCSQFGGKFAPPPQRALRLSPGSRTMGGLTGLHHGHRFGKHTHCMHACTHAHIHTLAVVVRSERGGMHAFARCGCGCVGGVWGERRGRGYRAGGRAHNAAGSSLLRACTTASPQPFASAPFYPHPLPFPAARAPFLCGGRLPWARAPVADRGRCRVARRASSLATVAARGWGRERYFMPRP